MKEKKLIGEVSQDQIDKWKADPQIQGVSGIIVGGHICYLKKPDSETIGHVLSQLSITVYQGDASAPNFMEMNMGRIYKQGEAVLTKCWLGGSDEIRNNSQLWAGACMKAGELVVYDEAEIINL